VPRHVARLVTRLVAPPVVDYFDNAARPVPRHVARLVTQHVVLLIVDYSASRRLVVDYSTSRGSSRGSSRHSSSTTSPPPHVRVPWHVAQLVTRLVAPPVVDYFDNVARPGASARRAAHHAARRAACRRLLRLAQAHRRLLHVTRLVAPLVVDYSASRRLVVDYFASSVRPGASARRAARRAARRRLL
jgi:hypothetical protein